MNIGKFGVIPVCILFHLVCRLAYIDYTRRANISFFCFHFLYQYVHPYSTSLHINDHHL